MNRQQDQITVTGTAFLCRRADGAEFTAASYLGAVSWLLGRPADRKPSRSAKVEEALILAVAALDGHEDRGRALVAAAEALSAR